MREREGGELGEKGLNHSAKRSRQIRGNNNREIVESKASKCVS